MAGSIAPLAILMSLIHGLTAPLPDAKIINQFAVTIYARQTTAVEIIIRLF